MRDTNTFDSNMMASADVFDDDNEQHYMVFDALLKQEEIGQDGRPVSKRAP